MLFFAALTFCLTLPALAQEANLVPIMAQEPRVYFIGDKLPINCKDELVGKSLIIINNRGSKNHA